MPGPGVVEGILTHPRPPGAHSLGEGRQEAQKVMSCLIYYFSGTYTPYGNRVVQQTPMEHRLYAVLSVQPAKDIEEKIYFCLHGTCSLWWDTESRCCGEAGSGCDRAEHVWAHVVGACLGV